MEASGQPREEPVQAAATNETKKIRYWPAVVIVTLYVIEMLVFWKIADVLPVRNLAMSIATAFNAILLFGWFLLLARYPHVVRLVGAMLVAVVLALVVGTVRFEGFGGDMTPLFAWRWTPTAEQHFHGEHAKRTPAPDATAAVDLATTTDHDFPGYMGADRTGVVRGIRLARDWSAQPPKELWRIPVGLGWSAFAVVGDFAVTQEQRADQEAVTCYELKTGQQRWAHAYPARFSEALGGDGPRATPTIHQGRVYALGASGVLNCLEGATGKPVWSTNILKDAGAENITWGMSGSPLVYDSFVVVNPGGADNHSLVAYHKDTGKKLWHSGTGRAAYSSPLLTTLGGVRQVVIFNGPGLEGYTADEGRPLWNFEWVTNGGAMISVSQPLIFPADAASKQPDRVFISSGYGTGCAMLELKNEGGKFTIQELWRNNNLKAKFTDMVVRDGFVYAMDENILSCLDLADGTRRWKAGRYGYGQLLLVDDLLLIQSEAGGLVLVEATPDEHRELARMPALSHKTWNHPVLAGRRLLVRNDREAVCFEMPIVEQPVKP